jgi:hypothetical protein
MKPANMTKLTAFASVVLATVLVLVPFHALLTVAASTITGHYEYLRLWKELVLLALAPLVGVIIWKTPGMWQRIRLQWQDGWLFWAIACYAVLHIILGLVALGKGQVNSYALLYAWIGDLRPMYILLLAWLLANQAPWLRQYWKRLVLWPAVVVIGFGLLQVTVLPVDFLHNFGYNVSTISPYETIDNKADYVRIQSTLRGSNPLGAYLVLVLSAVLVILGRRRTQHDLAAGALLVVGSIVLAATYSRSAYIGLVLSLFGLVVLAVRGRQAQRRLALGLVVMAVLAGLAFGVLRNNDHFENTFFHTNEHSRSAISSNEQRASALRNGLQDVLHEPFGRGPGTAGPASLHNVEPARISENYYLQIGQEVGWLGLGLFVAIIIMIAKRLWRQRTDPFACTLLVSLIGISFINLVQHAWMDDTLALLWWGLAGIALATAGRPAILKGKHHGKTKTAKKV